jgi:hypothetical protein
MKIYVLTEIPDLIFSPTQKKQLSKGGGSGLHK